MSEINAVTLETALETGDAEREISRAVGARNSIARKYVMRLRRRHPEASPAEVIRMLERHYAASISTAGALITAGAIAADVGIALIPVAGAAAAGAKSAGQQAAKKAGKEAAKGAAKAAAKSAAKTTALGVGRLGAQRVAALIPAGDEQLQFEITAVFGLAIAEIHGMDLDQEQARALVYGLSNGRVGAQQIATMAADVAEVSSDGVAGVGRSIAAGRDDWSHWASTLADSLPAGGAQSLVRTIQTGELDTVRQGLGDKQRATIEYGIGAVTGGVTRFVFGRDVIEQARVAFPTPPQEFPGHLALTPRIDADADADVEANRAVAALEDAAKATGDWISGTASALKNGVTTGAGVVGSGVATAAGAVTRPFRSVDLDGDGVPDEPQALTNLKGVGSTISGSASAISGSVAGAIKVKRRRRSDDD